jgi:RNA polymerase sigma factor (sigma-70 family)
MVSECGTVRWPAACVTAVDGPVIERPVPDIGGYSLAKQPEADDVDRRQRFTQLYEQHYDAVMRYAARRTDPDTARDVVAETFLVAWRRLDAVPGRTAETEPWLYAVARRILANADRSQRRADRVAARLAHQRPAAAQVPDPADAVAERARVERALLTLSDADREALRLIGWEELSLASAALAMGCSRTAMAVRLHRARRRLASALESGGSAGPAARTDPTDPGRSGRVVMSTEEQI